MGRSKALIEKALRIDGLSYHAKVSTYTDPTHFKADDLAGWGDDFFANSKWYVFVARDSGGAGAAPDGELQPISDYASSDGTFTHTAFTAILAVGDEILIVHKSVAAAIAGGGGGVDTGGISIWDSFEYPTDASLNAKWTGTSVTLTRSLTAFYAHYSMQAAVAGAGGEAHRNFAIPQDIGALRNISVAARCNNAAGDTFQFTLYDSSGNYSYWTQTLTLVNTWYTFDIDPHSTPTGDGGTPVDLDDVVQIRFAALTNTTTYLFDLIMLESLMSSIIGLGYDGLDDALETTSSVRGHLLDIVDDYLKYLTTSALGAHTEYSIADVLKISATEKIKNFIAKTGGNEIPVGESIYNSIKHIVNTAVTGAGVANSIVNKLDLGVGYKPASDQYYTATRGPYLDILNTDSKYILSTALTAPTVNSLTRFIASGGTALGTPLPASKSLYDGLSGGIDAVNRVAGKRKILEKTITSAANAGDVTVATITTQPCVIESIIISANAAQTTDLTSCGTFGGAGKVVTFINAGDATQANLDAVDKQVAWTGAVRLSATKTIVMSLVGTGATTVDLTVTISYRAAANGGYLA